MQDTRRKTTIKKHKAVVDFFNHLFEEKRMRMDDSIKKTSEKFFYSTVTVEIILREALKDEVVIHSCTP